MSLCNSNVPTGCIYKQPFHYPGFLYLLKSNKKEGRTFFYTDYFLADLNRIQCSWVKNASSDIHTFTHRQIYRCIFFSLHLLVPCCRTHPIPHIQGKHGQMAQTEFLTEARQSLIMELKFSAVQWVIIISSFGVPHNNINQETLVIF